MSEQKEKRRPLPIKNLAEFKRAMQLGAEFTTTYHTKHPDTVGLTRVVSEVHTNCIYSKIKDQPNHRLSASNDGKGFRTDFEKADRYHFGNGAVDVLNPKTGEIVYSFEVYGMKNTLNESEDNKMNEWEMNERMAVRFKKAYPPGTRIMLLHMDDPYAPVPEGTRGTVKHVDDQAKIHVSWDNGSSLAVIPGEDAYRRLTEEELAEEQESELTENESGPVMGM